MARILVTWLSHPTSFHSLAALIPPFAALLRLFAAHVVHLIADLLRTVLRLFLPYAMHAMQQFASDASTLTGQIGPLANFQFNHPMGRFTRRRLGQTWKVGPTSSCWGWPKTDPTYTSTTFFAHHLSKRIICGPLDSFVTLSL